jgi:hypothetical protein
MSMRERKGLGFSLDGVERSGLVLPFVENPTAVARDGLIEERIASCAEEVGSSG